MHIILLLFLLVILLFHFVTYGLLMFTCLITFDGIFSALHFMYMYIKNGLSKTDVVKNTSLLYRLSCMDRYIWYILCALVYQTICGILWLQNSKIFLALGILLNLPYVQNFLVGDKPSQENDNVDTTITISGCIHMISHPLFTNITRIKKIIIIEMLSKQLSAIINLIAKNLLNKKKKIISHHDTRKLFDHYNDMVNHMITIFKNTLIVLLINYLKTRSQYYSSFVQQIYNYRAESSLNTMNRHAVHDIINDICEKKQWNRLLEPDFIQVIIYMYVDDEFKNKDNIFTKKITNIQYSILKFFAVWTLSSFIVYTANGTLILLKIYY